MVTPLCRVYLKMPFFVESDNNLLLTLENIAYTLSSTYKATSMLSVRENPKVK